MVRPASAAPGGWLIGRGGPEIWGSLRHLVFDWQPPELLIPTLTLTPTPTPTPTRKPPKLSLPRLQDACDWARGLLLPGRYEFTSYVTDSHHTVHYAGAGHLMLRPDFTCSGSDTIASAAHGTLRRGMANVPWSAPGGPGRRALSRGTGGAGPPGAQPLSRVLELAASKVADCTALRHAGAAPSPPGAGPVQG